ncbi:DUF3857 domain-containing protein [Sabulilitoribacter arenilitoris]|uniref:DUF3857 domain-containing protein n=1 Tax=Wocania arenilitoris TaxID=2044858 RepID=A0AAE3JLR6_9FLAO|nr:DUF3857 domain-containing protein [Wocania arenilitoris]MCF7569543.1 DUF3857 domain-containing protein [Wocania arenilitoris]
MVLKPIVNIMLLLATLTAFSQDDLYSSLTIPDDLKKGANAVVRLNEMHVVIESQNKILISLDRVVTVFNEKGNQHLQAGVGYDNHIKVKKIEAVIFDENGEVLKKKKKRDFIDYSAVDGGTLYSDSRVLFLGYTPINYPYTVKFSYEVESVNTAAIPTWRPINSYFLSVEKDSFILNDQANLGLRSKEISFDEFQVKKSTSSNTLSYTISNVPPIKPEDLSPSLNSITPYAMVAVEKFHFNGVDGHAKNWNEFGNWIRNSLLKGRNEVTEKTKQQILDLVKGIDNPIEKAKKVYEFVQNNTRYISVQVGIGGVQPIAALEVDNLKYGDCKGLTNYTQSLLSIAGVKSYYTVVEAGKEIIDFDTDFASLEQGNHIILGIPNNDEMIWLDCTSQIHPFGFIGDFTDDRKVLVIKQDYSEILKTINYPDSINYQFTKADIKLSVDGSINSEVTIKTKGVQYDNRFYIERKSKKDIDEYYKEYWGNVNNLEINDYSFENDKEDVEFTEKIKSRAQNYGSINGDRLIFAPNAFNKNSFIPNRYRNRKLPVEIQRGYLDEDSFSYTIPNEYVIESLPENVSIKNKFGEYFIEFIQDGNKILYNRKLKILKGKYPKLEYDLYRNFRKKISKMDNYKIILKKL